MRKFTYHICNYPLYASVHFCTYFVPIWQILQMANSVAFRSHHCRYLWLVEIKSGQKPCGRQLNAKVCGSESAIFCIFFLDMTTMFNNDISQTGLSTHCHFSTKLMLITVRSSTTTQCLHSFKFTLVNQKVNISLTTYLQTR